MLIFLPAQAHGDVRQGEPKDRVQCVTRQLRYSDLRGCGISPQPDMLRTTDGQCGIRTDGEDREHVLLPFSLHVAEQTVDALVDLAARAVGD